MHDDSTRRPVTTLGRRKLMKLGAGIVATALGAPKAAAQGGGQAPGPAQPPGSFREPGVPRPHTGPGYKYTANRRSNNGEMDETTKTIVKWVHEYDASKMTPSVINSINRTMVDSMAAIVSGFEEEPVRIAMKLAKQSTPVGLKSTIFGYGIMATPELASFANGCLIRMTDFNDASSHLSNMIPGALAVGEALHSSGSDVMAAIAIGYECFDAGTGESVPPAMAAAKLMGLDEDQMANALTLALTPHVALNKGVGAMSMWKGCRSAEATKCGIWAALMAREGMTGPPQPFEGRGGLWSRNGRRDVKMPNQPVLAIERQWFKRRPAEASSQGPLELIPEMRAWTKPEEIDSIVYDMTDLGEISDNPKWDPRNRETADHSMPFIFARALLDGDIYLDSFTEAKYMDPKARALMNKMTFGKVNGWRGNGVARIMIKKTNGESKTWDTFHGLRALDYRTFPRMSDEEVSAKFNKACDYMKVDKAQRDRAREMWWNIGKVKDIGEAIQTMAKFGQPKPL